MPELYREKFNDARANAQANLCGRTHYVDDDTLRFHKSRVIACRQCAAGLLFWLITSDAQDWEGRRRTFRYTVFDLFGQVLTRLDLEHGFSNSRKAAAAMWTAINAIDARLVTIDGIARETHWHAIEMKDVALALAEIEAAGKLVPPLPDGVTAIGLDDPAELHRALDNHLKG